MLAEQKTAGNDKLFFLPYLLGERTMGSSKGKGCFIGMTLTTTPGQMLRAVMEGQVFDNKRILDIFTGQGYEVEEYSMQFVAELKATYGTRFAQIFTIDRYIH